MAGGHEGRLPPGEAMHALLTCQDIEPLSVRALLGQPEPQLAIHPPPSPLAKPHRQELPACASCRPFCARRWPDTPSCCQRPQHRTAAQPQLPGTRPHRTSSHPPTTRISGEVNGRSVRTARVVVQSWTWPLAQHLPFAQASLSTDRRLAFVRDRVRRAPFTLLGGCHFGSGGVGFMA
jgi:hypothetical protein